LTKSDDAALHERWLTARDGDAFAELARRHAQVVYDLAARTLGDRTAAEDVVQEALLDLALEPTRKPAEVGVPAWLVRFAICRARNQRSSERSRARRQLVVGSRRPEETMPDEDLERKEELESALAVAEPEERAILAMRYLHGWEYDQIAHALETSEGAARVRVHRALANVRGRLGVGGGRGSAQEKAIVHRMAGIAMFTMPSFKIDAAIRGAISAASAVPTTTAPAPRAPASRLPSSVRMGVQAFGAALLVAGAASWCLQSSDSSSQSATVDSTPLVLVADASAPAAAARDGASSASRPVADRVGATPRPEDWDRGALARLARGDADVSSGAEPTSANRPSEKPADAPAPAPVVPPAAPVVPAAQAPVAPAAPEVVPAVRPEVEERPSSAFRPSARGASAANCDPGSSDGERADALGGLPKSATDPVVDRQVVVEQKTDAPIVDKTVESAARRRVPARVVAVAAVVEPPETGLVEQAMALVRDAVTQAAPTTDADAAVASDAASLKKARAATVRTLRKQYQAVRRATPKQLRLSSRAAARINRLMSMLVDLATADARATANDVRWPDGVDPTTALQEVMRVLATMPQTATPRVPDAAPPTNDASIDPQTPAAPTADPATPSAPSARTPELR